MEQAELDRFRQILVAWRAELLGKADGAVTTLAGMAEASPDPLDRAAFEEGRDYLIRIRSRENRLLKKIAEALERIDTGTYGVCDICGEEIGIGRLEVRPVTTQCIACKTRLEAEEKTYGIG
jgi:DnaK suppressor protein